MQVKDLTVTQIRVFPVDVIPLNLITTKSCIGKVRDALSVNEIETRPLIEGKSIIIFRRGELKERNRLIIINKIEVEPRRVIIEVVGTSKEANQVYKTFVSTLVTVINKDLENLRIPLLIAETTRCVVTLHFAFEALFNSTFINFLNKKIKEEASDEVADASVRPLSAIAEITYRIKDKILIDNNITMNPKQFSIAPRMGAPADSKSYIISSPFDSEKHLKLIKELNHSMVTKMS